MTRRYPAYIHTGLEWLGEVPATWEIVRLGSCFAERREKVSDKDFPALSVTMNGIVPQIETAAKTDDGDNRRLVRAGDFVINSRSDRKGSSGLSQLDGSVSLISIVITPRRNIFGPYSNWLLKSRVFQEEFYRWGSGIVADLWTTRYGDMSAITLALPPLPEQTAIADFLDRETAKIDTLMAEQRRLIDLLREKRQAVISRAVTKGLNPNAPLKPSGIDWLGDVPEEWEVNKFARLISISEGQVDPRDEPYASMILIAPNHIESGTGRLSELETAADQGAESGKYMFDKGAVIYSKIRPALAKVVVAPSAGLCSADMYPLTSRGKLRQDYLAWLLLSPGFTAWAILESDRVAMPKINREKLNELHLPVPPLEVQREIVDFIDTVTTKLDALTATAETAISLLQERRAALISAAVTGKIDVRHLSPAATEAA